MHVPFFRISLANATVLSCVYLAVGAIVEVVRRTLSPRWADYVADAMEDFPARLLDLFGLLEPVRLAFVHDRLDVWHVRAIFGLVTVGMIFAIGLTVGALMWGLAKLTTRTSADE